MEFIATDIAGLFLVVPKTHADERGWFARTFCKKTFLQNGLDVDFVQFNQSFNKCRGTFRGMHYQLPPFAEKKLVRCVSGAVMDFVVDLRAGSKTFLQKFTVELSAENRTMIFLPEGVAHGFLTLEDNTSLLYHHSEYYSAEYERGISYRDPALKLELPFEVRSISERDLRFPQLPEGYAGIG